MNGTLILGGAAAAALLLARKRKSTDVPPEISEAAKAALPPGVEDYAALYRRERDALIAKVGSTTGASCAQRGLGTCFQNPAIRIPKPDRAALGPILRRWAVLAGSIGADSGTPGSFWWGNVGLAADVASYAPTLLVMQQNLFFGLSEDANRRAWAALARLSIALQGVLVHNGDAYREAGATLKDELTDPAKYAEAAGGLLVDVLDAGVKAINSKFGALAAVGAVAYLVTR